MRHGEHHILERRRAKTPIPQSVTVLDRLCIIVAIILPLVTLPQIIQVILLRDASGISLLTWSLYFLGTIPMLLYGFVHKEKPIIIMNILWLIMNLLMIIVASIY